MTFCVYIIKNAEESHVDMVVCYFIFKWFNRSDRFSSDVKVGKCVGFRLGDLKTKNRFHWLIHGV